MYYDLVLAALPVALLLTEPSRFLDPHFVALRLVHRADLGDAAAYYKPRLTREHPPEMAFSRAGYESVWVLNSFVLTLLAALLVIQCLFPLLDLEAVVSVGFLKTSSEAVAPALRFYTRLNGTPWDTFCLMALWVWCGWRCLRDVSPRSPEARGERSPEARG
jgi:hypothetical protein